MNRAETFEEVINHTIKSGAWCRLKPVQDYSGINWNELLDDREVDLEQFEGLIDESH